MARGRVRRLAHRVPPAAPPARDPASRRPRRSVRVGSLGAGRATGQHPRTPCRDRRRRAARERNTGGRRDRLCYLLPRPRGVSANRSADARSGVGRLRSGGGQPAASPAGDRPNDCRLLLDGYRAFREQRPLYAMPWALAVLNLRVRLKNIPVWMLEESDAGLRADEGYRRWLAMIEIGRTLDSEPVDV